MFSNGKCMRHVSGNAWIVCFCHMTHDDSIIDPTIDEERTLLGHEGDTIETLHETLLYIWLDTIFG